MKSMHVELPERLALELESVVRDGWFPNQNEVVRAALVQFLRDRRFELAERYQFEDIAWALRHKK